MKRTWLLLPMVILLFSLSACQRSVGVGPNLYTPFQLNLPIPRFLDL